MSELKIHSDVAWGIAIQFSDFLASDTRTLAALIDKALEAQAKERAGGWQEIETYPNDKTRVNVYMPDADYKIQTGYAGLNATSNPMWVVGGHFAFDIGTPTLWQPLPLPPEGT